MVGLLVGGTVGGTLAWITMKTTTVTNTFTAGDIEITLTESENLDLKMVPGKELTKDPKVTVTAGNEACWVFVEVTKTGNIDSYIEYSINSAWKSVTGYENVYYQVVEATEVSSDPTVDGNTCLPILTGDKVKVKDILTKADMTTIKSSAPSLAFTAYAIQTDVASEAPAAWVQAMDLNK